MSNDHSLQLHPLIGEILGVIRPIVQRTADMQDTFSISLKECKVRRGGEVILHCIAAGDDSIIIVAGDQKRQFGVDQMRIAKAFAVETLDKAMK